MLLRFELSARCLPSGDDFTTCRKRTVLSSSMSSVQMYLAPLKPCSKNGCFGPTCSSVSSFAGPQLLSSKSMANQFSGIVMFSTHGFLMSRSIGPHENFFALQLAFVTVPSPNFKMKPASPI